MAVLPLIFALSDIYKQLLTSPSVLANIYTPPPDVVHLVGAMLLLICALPDMFMTLLSDNSTPPAEAETMLSLITPPYMLNVLPSAATPPPQLAALPLIAPPYILNVLSCTYTPAPL